MSLMTKKTTWILLTIVVILAVLVAWFFLGIPLAYFHTVKAGPLVTTIQFSGRVATLSRVDIGSTITGRVTQVALKEGDKAKAGDTLVAIENEELFAALAQAKANEQLAIARMRGLQSSGRRALDATVSQASAVLTAVQSELQRTEALVSKGFLSQARLVEVRRSAEVAAAQLDNAKAQRTALSDQGSEIAQARAQLAVASSASAGAATRLNQTTIRAPQNATVLARHVEPGQIVQPGKPLFTLALDGPRRLKSLVDERYLDQLRLGQPAWVVADAFPEQKFSATVLSIAPLIDSHRGAVEVVFDLAAAQAPDFLREDMTLSIEVETARKATALLLPIDAIRIDQITKAAHVLVDSNGHAERRPVRIGLRSLEYAEVLEGLREGEAVLLGSTVSDGQRIRSTALQSPAEKAP
jgi:HlyD family secretion protein